jgi:hypothetical protein
MILDRLYTPSNDQLIYHYCPAQAFIDIITSKTVWLSAFYALNDTTERSWGYLIFEKAIKELERDVDSTFIDNIRTLVNATYFQSLVMIGSFSLDADVISQWRAYADDGRGFAIGFSPKLIKAPAKKLRVLYEEQLQLQELLANLKHVHDYEKSIGYKYDEKFEQHLFHVGADLCAYKHPAFREEREIRLAHLAGLAPEGKSRKIIPLGAIDPDGRRLMSLLRRRLSKPLETRFRHRNGVLVPYVAMDYTHNGKLAPVKEVVLGPCNENHEWSIELFLNALGMKGATVRRSIIPYR